METAAAILTQILFDNEIFSNNIDHKGGLVGDPPDIADKIRPYYAATLKMVDEENRLRR
jgi:hypothetical protein